MANLFQESSGESAAKVLEGKQGFSQIREEAQTSVGETLEEPGRSGRLRGRAFKHLFPEKFDPHQAMVETRVAMTVSTNRVLADDDFVYYRDKIFELNQVSNRNDAYVLAFTRSMCIAHAKNSGSVLQPGRAVFVLTENGKSDKFNFFLDIVDYLGADHRRFFRQYADFTRAELLDILKHRGEAAYEADVRDIEWIAAERGLTRYPHLIHDTADACSNLSSQERVALQASKASVLAAYVGKNPVDNPVSHRGGVSLQGSGMPVVQPKALTSGPSVDGLGY